MTVQEKVPFHCQRSHFSFLHFDYVQTEVNDAYYNLIVALLSCPSGTVRLQRKLLRGLIMQVAVLSTQAADLH